MIAVVGILLSLCVILKLHELDIYPLREATKIIRRPWFETFLLLFCVGGLIQYGATKGTNGTENANQPSRLTQRSGLQSGDLRGSGDGRGETFAITNLCFTGIVPLSNSVCLSVAWPTNMFAEGTTLDFFAKVNALTNGWTWLEAYATVPFATNLEVEIAYPILASSLTVPAAMFFRVQDRNTCALTMRDSDLDGIPDVYELHNGTNPYVPDSGSVPRLTVGQNGTYASVEAALADSMAYSVIALGGETFVQSKSLVMPSHPVLIEGPDGGYAVIQSDSEIGAIMLTDGQDAQTMFRNLIVDLRAQGNFQAGFWVGGNTPWTGRGAAATFENVRIRANYPGVEHFGWLFYGNDGGSSVLRQCVMNAAGSTWAYGVSSFNAASNVIEDCAFMNMPTNAGETAAIAVLSRELTNVVVESWSPEVCFDLSWAGYPYDGSYSSTADADGDGISDYDEIFSTNTDPWLDDSDGDGISDGEEDVEGTDPRNLNSHGYRLVISVKNADVLPNVTNYVFIGSGDSQWSNMVYSCYDEGGSTNFIWKINDGALIVSSFRDLNRNGIVDFDDDIVLSNRVSGLQAVANLTFSFGDVDDDGVGDLQERLDETDPYSKTSLKISRTVRISNNDSDSSITNYYAISQSQYPDDVQWTRMSSDVLSFGVSQKTMTGCLYALVYRDFNRNGVYDEGIDALHDKNRFVLGSTVFDVPVGDVDGDTINDSIEVREGTDPLNARSYCYQVSARIGGIFATTNHLICNAVFGTNEILTATVLTNAEFALSLGHQSTTNGEVVTLWFWDDANSNLVKDVEETCTSIAIKPNGHEVVHEGTLPTSAFDKDHNGLMDWWEVQTGLAVLDESHKETDDNDHDGLINLHEYWAGTDPLTPDGSNTLLSVCARSIDDRIKMADPSVALDRFVDYVLMGDMGRFIPNTNCWASDIDMSCASMWHTGLGNHPDCQTTNTAVTAISARHVIYANHFGYAMSTNLVYFFYGTDGNVYTNRLVKYSGLGLSSDIGIGVLEHDLPDVVCPAMFLPDDFYQYVGNGKLLPVLTIDQRETAVIHDLNGLTMMGERSSLMSASVSTIQARQMFGKSFIGGDSSSPRFLVVGNKLIILGTLWRGGGGSSCNATLFKREIQSKMDQMLPGYQLKVMDLSDFDTLGRYGK